MRVLSSLLVLVPFLFAGAAWAQAAPDTQTVSCNFDDNMQISVQYVSEIPKGKEPKNGAVWAPGGAPMTLFTQTPVVINNVTIPVGAFSMFAIPGKNAWTLVVNRNVTAGSSYDVAQDMVRAPMEVGDLSEPLKELKVSFAHVGAKQCNIRLYYGKVGAFADIGEK